MINNLLNRFLKYVSIDTTSDSTKENNPSTESQRTLATLLIKELEDLQVDEIYCDETHCYVYAKVNGDKSLPKIGFIAHMDTSEDAKGNNINPQIIENYDGSQINLNGIVLDSKNFPSLNDNIGKTLITSDGTTLLGADNKAGIAEIMTMLELLKSSDIRHGDIYVCFTPDEEIGLGTLNFNKDYFDVDFAYTVDGGPLGEFSYENFNAASAFIEVSGISAHCGTAKDKMINASKVAIEINEMLPKNECPEKTDNYDGFFHLDEMNGTVSNATLKYLIRDFDKDNFEKRKEVMTSIVNEVNKKYNNCIKLTIKDTYKNMLNEIEKEPSLIETTKKAISNLNIKVDVSPIRGGTDGASLSYKGIPCPNLGVGAYNFHSVYEYACLEDMNKVSELLIEIIKEFCK